jgi:hypothetical protein
LDFLIVDDWARTGRTVLIAQAPPTARKKARRVNGVDRLVKLQLLNRAKVEFFELWS